MHGIQFSPRGLFPLLLAAAVLIPWRLAHAQGAGDGGVQWENITLDQALQEAAAKDKTIMIEFWGSHCAECATVTSEVWDTPDGAELAEDTIPIRIETTTPEGKAAQDRYPLTGLPCVIFVRSDGTEIDRVEGYWQKQRFLDEARSIKSGLDPLPRMETLLKQHPDSTQLVLGVLQRYMWRKRVADVDTLYARALRMDPSNQRQMAEATTLAMARYQHSVLRDPAKTLATWQLLADRFPACGSIGAALEGTRDCLSDLGRYQEWSAWVCPLIEKNPLQAGLQRAAVSVALRQGYQSPCLAKAARIMGPLDQTRTAWYDSVAVYFEGRGPKPR